jgi:hypothetical protein
MRRGSLVHTGRQSRAQRQSVVVQRRPMAGDDEQAVERRVVWLEMFATRGAWGPHGRAFLLQPARSSCTLGLAGATGRSLAGDALWATEREMGEGAALNFAGSRGRWATSGAGGTACRIATGPRRKPFEAVHHVRRLLVQQPLAVHETSATASLPSAPGHRETAPTPQRRRGSLLPL